MRRKNILRGLLCAAVLLGAALVGAHVGETVVAQTPGGALRIKVIEIAL